jgi:hypothetical protein
MRKTRVTSFLDVTRVVVVVVVVVFVVVVVVVVVVAILQKITDEAQI